MPEKKKVNTVDHTWLVCFYCHAYYPNKNCGFCCEGDSSYVCNACLRSEQNCKCPKVKKPEGKLMLYQDAKTTDVYDGVERDRHVCVNVGWYADATVSFEIFVVRPAVIRTRRSEALAFTLTHVQELGLHPSLVRGVFVERSKKPKELKTDVDGYRPLL